VKIKDVKPAVLREVSDKELLSLHLRTHQLYGANFGPDAPAGRGYKDDKGVDAVDGLRLSDDGALAIWKGAAKVVRLRERLGNFGRPFFLLSPSYAYGIIRLGKPRKDSNDYPVEYFRGFKVPLKYEATGDGTIPQKVAIVGEEKMSLEDLVHAHLFIKEEMERRKLDHNRVSELDDEKLPTAKAAEVLLDRELTFWAAGEEGEVLDVDSA